GGGLKLYARGSHAIINSFDFVARIAFEPAKIDWLVERSPPRLTESERDLPRPMRQEGLAVWIGTTDRVVAEVELIPGARLAVTARNLDTGKQIWQYEVPTPEAADWAEKTPAWPGAQTEEIYGFFANDPDRLIFCLFRQTRRSMLSSPSR